MIKTLFFDNGNVAATDEHGRQVAEEQHPAWEIILRDKLARGVISMDTTVLRSAYPEETVQRIMSRLEPLTREAQ